MFDEGGMSAEVKKEDVKKSMAQNDNTNGAQLVAKSVDVACR